METFATTVYVIADEVLKLLDVSDDVQSLMSNAEIATFVIVSAQYFSSNFKLARFIFQKLRIFLKILSNSRMSRRIHQLPFNFWQAITNFLAIIFKEVNTKNAYAVDSFPVFSCQKSRIDKRQLFTEKKYLGFAASKKRYFCGIKVHMIVTTRGEPVEVFFSPGSASDVSTLWEMKLDIPLNSKLYADGAYNSFDLEDILKEEGIELLAKRGSLAKNRVRSPDLEREISSKRQIVETAFSSITDKFPRNLRAVTEQGFYIKVWSFILAYSLSFICHPVLV